MARAICRPAAIAVLSLAWALAPASADESPSEKIRKALDQPIDLDLKETSLAKVVDQKAAKQAEKKVSLQVEDVALETAVRLLAEQAGMKAARIDNVLYVTTPEQAASIAADNRALVPNYGPYGPLFNAVGGVGAL